MALFVWTQVTFLVFNGMSLHSVYCRRTLHICNLARFESEDCQRNGHTLLSWYQRQTLSQEVELECDMWIVAAGIWMPEDFGTIETGT